jgi:hypothetical protein
MPGTTVTVVVPTFNRADLLPRTLAAIRAQTQPPDEVIVVDDGSCDATPGILAQAGHWLRAIRIPNSGELVARNTGLSAASSDLVAFCDSDDVWQPNHLVTMTALWREEPALKAAYANFHLLRGGVAEGTDKFRSAPAGFWHGLRRLGAQAACFDTPPVERLIAYQPFFPSCMVVDRDHFRGRGGWDERAGRMVSCDLATHLRVAEEAPIGVSFEPTVGIRKHAGNYSADVQAMNLGDAAILESFLQRRADLAHLIIPSIGERRGAALSSAFARGDHTAVAAIAALIPPASWTWRLRVKAAVARLPSPLRGPLASVLLTVGSALARVPGAAPRPAPRPRPADAA